MFYIPTLVADLHPQETPFQGYMIKFIALTLWIGIFLAERSSGLSFIDEQEDDEEEMGESS